MEAISKNTSHSINFSHSGLHIELQSIFDDEQDFVGYRTLDKDTKASFGYVFETTTGFETCISSSTFSSKDPIKAAIQLLNFLIHANSI
jgi:hypothetical protein